MFAYCLNEPIQKNDSFGVFSAGITADVPLEVGHTEINMGAYLIILDVSARDTIAAAATNPNSTMDANISTAGKSVGTKNIRLIASEAGIECSFNVNLNNVDVALTFNFFNLSASGSYSVTNDNVTYDITVTVKPNSGYYLDKLASCWLDHISKKSAVLTVASASLAYALIPAGRGMLHGPLELLR